MNLVFEEIKVSKGNNWRFSAMEVMRCHGDTVTGEGAALVEEETPVPNT
jgi:hypothetical protein